MKRVLLITSIIVNCQLSIINLNPAFAQDYRVHSFCWERVEVTSALDAKPSAEAAAIVAPYKTRVDSIMAPPLGLSRVAMTAKRPESLLGNWAADVMVEGGTATGLEPADMGLVNVGGLRNTMPEGIVRRGDIMLISPFENYVVVLELKGSDLLELMKNIAAVKGEGVSSSVRMEITSDGELLSCTIDGKEIDPHRIYTVATIDYLAEGNDKMYALKKAVKRHEIGILARDIMMEYVLKHRVIDSKLEGRITIK
ncbi:MAG: 5'-nucleotidase C-terminal domain-containing protein [Bacteroidaceae bacterium]|nr:5'-nucleotidase C-terminal domain-containing protein [Bacteroidaceae bacterium]